MKRIAMSIVAAAILSAITGCSAHRNAVASKSDDANAIVIIFFDSTVGNADLKKAAEAYGSRVVYDYTQLNGMAVTVPKGKTVNDAVSYYQGVNGVVSAQPDQKMELY